MMVKLIPGTPNHSTKRLAELIWTVDEHFMPFLFGSPDNWYRLFSIDWCADKGINSHAYSVVAVDDDEIAGVMIGYNAAIIDSLFEATLSRWLQDEPPEQAAYLEQAFNKMDRLFPHPAEGSFYILDLAVDVTRRKTGVGRRLVDRAVSEAKSQGLSALKLDVDADSEAVGFYERLGMSIEVETFVPEIAEKYDVGSHLHMKMEIK